MAARGLFVALPLLTASAAAAAETTVSPGAAIDAILCATFTPWP